MSKEAATCGPLGSNKKGKGKFPLHDSRNDINWHHKSQLFEEDLVGSGSQSSTVPASDELAVDVSNSQSFPDSRPHCAIDVSPNINKKRRSG